MEKKILKNFCEKENALLYGSFKTINTHLPYTIFKDAQHQVHTFDIDTTCNNIKKNPKFN